MGNNILFIFDVDGTLTNTTIYTPIFIELKSRKKYYLLLLLYIFSPLIILLDKISRPLHQFFFYKFFRSVIKNYRSRDELKEILEQKIINKTKVLINNILKKGYDVFFISTNCNLINSYLKLYKPKGIYTVNTDNSEIISLEYLKTFKEKSLFEIKKMNPLKEIIGIADSKSDIPFLKKCAKGYLLIRDQIRKI